MSHRALTGLVALVCLAAASARAATDPHLDPALVPGSCRACHVGHGASRSPMLPRPQAEVCLACHDSRAGADEQVRRGLLAPSARPPLIGEALRQAAVHPLSPGAYSRLEPGAVTCASCHSPHRRSTPLAGAPAPGVPRLSTRDPQRLEHELCESCHGSAGAATQSPRDLSRLFDPSSRSFHPVHAPTEERSPSVARALAGRRISCTDCHDDGDPRGARGPHGSPFGGLLVANYVLGDGAAEGRTTYELCWSCHDREIVLGEASTFPLHRLHVVDERTSCATCHSPHGSIGNRALILFGEQTAVPGVSASVSLGRLEFASESPGSGSCTLTCHGVDHAPLGYGAEARRLQMLRAAGASRPLVAPTVPPRPPAGAFGGRAGRPPIEKLPPD